MLSKAMVFIWPYVDYAFVQDAILKDKMLKNRQPLQTVVLKHNFRYVARVAVYTVCMELLASQIFGELL